MTRVTFHASSLYWQCAVKNVKSGSDSADEQDSEKLMELIARQ
jgi:hypothetical protein